VQGVIRLKEGDEVVVPPIGVPVLELLVGDGAIGRGVLPSRGVDDLLGVLGEGGKPLVLVEVVDGGGIGGVGRGGEGGGGNGA
jgi:hypothetical protein